MLRDFVRKERRSVASFVVLWETLKHSKAERFVRKEAQPSRDIAALGIYVSPCGSYVRGEVTMLLRLCRTTRFRPIWKLQMATEKVDSIVCSIAMGAALPQR